MIVKNHSGKATNPNLGIYILGGVILVVSFVLAINIDWASLINRSAVISQVPEPVATYSCDAETVVSDERGKRFQDGGHFFGNGDLQSDENAHSGMYACKLTEKYPFGFTFALQEGVEPGDRYEVSIWRFRSDNLTVELGGNLVVHIQETKDYLTQNMPDIRESSGWERISMRFVVPSDYKGGGISIYAYHTHKDPVWYDDLKIIKIPSEQSAFVLAAEDTVFRQIDLRISDKGMEKLQIKRREAFQKWLLVTEDDDWIKGKIGRKEDEISVKLRLKGDLLDHLIGDKWSFRVRTKAPESWNRLMTFSLQNPATRNFLAEWCYHEFLKQEDVLCPRYDFVRLFLNGKNLGPYAYEEHFEKQLLEFRGRREGPIVKFAEEAMWQARRRDLYNELKEKTTEHTLNQYEAAEPEAFRESKILADSNMAQQYALAQSLMEAYQFGEKPVDEVFDLDRLARYYAITDIFKAYHGIIWHNQRFYYNPIIGKLEPIGYDGFVFESEMNWVGRPFMLFQRAEKEGDLELDLVNQLFLDQPFVERYISYLWQYSQAETIENFFFDMDKAISQREALIREEVEDYSLDKNFFKRSARETHALILPMANALRSHAQKNGELIVANTHALPLRILGYGLAEKEPDFRFAEAIWLKPHSPQRPPAFQEIAVSKEATYFFYEIPGLDSVFTSVISRSPAPVTNTPPQALFADVKLQSNDIYVVDSQVVVFPAGKYRVAKDIIIPPGYQVKFEAGVSLDLVKGAAFVSKSAVQMYGNAEAPIRIFSSDKTAHGFTVLQAKERSVMSYVNFQGLNTLIKSGWKLTGAVTFFESDVTIRQCAFRDNSCEDALNLVRCTFTMNESLVANTFADGFDADFCQGEVGRCKFIETGNDGMDFSGSVITISNCEVISPGDKGLSVGEEATIHVISLKISNAILGVASKDFSKLTIDHISLTNCETGFSAYQKKPEYGPATITVKAYEAEGVKRLHMIEQGSVLSLVGREAETI